MEKSTQKIEAYSPEWFKKHALESIKPIRPGVWDYSDSLLLYIPGSDESYETLQAVDNPYHRIVTAPERAYLESTAELVATELPESFEYIDLGPGTEHKEQFLFDALKAQGKAFTYRPVDISKRFLELSSEHAKQQGIPVDPLNTSFEELPEKLGPITAPRFVSLGLTYSNYEPKVVLSLLKKLIGESGYALINSQLRERTDMDALVPVYREDARGMVEGKFGLLGLNVTTDVSAYRTDDAIKTWATVNKVTPALERKGVKAGDELLIFQSLRPTKESLQADVKSEFPNASFFDTGSPFVSTLLKT